ncbi:alpha/beta hydrolase [Streptomyces sp. NPDC003077]|uniref:alpha/beta hydrolase n=1 Tax=Streptomyces sp. NPDC003077 TaxID=3154443 RepID=UPI0033BB1F5E
MTAPEPSVRDVIGAPHPDHAPLPPAAPREPGVRELRGVPYGLVEGGRPLELDLWLPNADQPHQPEPVPLVLFVHGGAWRRGRRNDMGLGTRSWNPGPFARLAAAGFAVAGVDYRLSGEATFPAPLDDLRAALRWLTLRSAELGIDTGRTVVWGESAGGHLASLLALTPSTSTPSPLGALTPATPSPLGVVTWYAPSDLTTARGHFTPEDPASFEALMLGAAPAAVPERARAASPVAQAHADAPPFLLMHGDEDSMVPCSHSEALAEALEKAGAPVELRRVAGADHGWYGLPEARVEEIFSHSLAFVRRVTA